MFTIDGKLVLLNVKQDYLRALYDVCTEVYYKPTNYENKPYIGILINNGGRKYILPLTSAKQKHKKWSNVHCDCFLIYETANKADMRTEDIWVEMESNSDTVKHIMSVLDVKKMIPIVDGDYSVVNINPDVSDSEDMKKYKDLLNKEYRFCLKKMSDILARVNKLYDKQMKTGKIAKFCCDFKVLEAVADSRETV